MSPQIEGPDELVQGIAGSERPRNLFQPDTRTFFDSRRRLFRDQGRRRNKHLAGSCDEWRSGWRGFFRRPFEAVQAVANRKGDDLIDLARTTSAATSNRLPLSVAIEVPRKMRIQGILLGVATLILLPLSLVGSDTSLQGEIAAAALRRSGHYESLNRAFRDSQHRVETQGKAFGLQNPENGLTVEFHDGGMMAEHSSGRFGLSLEACGYGNHPPIAPAATIHAAGSRIEYRRGSLTEWYVNDSRGIEQGFTLREPPANPDGGPLAILLKVSGDMTPILTAGHIELRRDGRAVLRYTGLLAWDSTGRQLPAHMTVDNGRIRLLVEDAAAAYPITVDPWIQQQEVSASDAANNDNFGYSVSVSGSTAVIGAPMKNSSQGAAYVFVLSGSIWTQQQKLTASDGVSQDQFGKSVSLNGDSVVIGASGRVSGTGAAYVFVRSGTTWTQQQRLTASDPGGSNYFGISLSLNGDTAVVGAFGASAGRGAAYVFVRSGTTWTQQQKLTASDGVSLDQFGWSVSVNADTAVIGADFKNAAYVFVRSGTTWSQQQELTASDAVNGDYFGWSVSVSGDTAVISDSIKTSNQGVAYVFVRSGTTWTQQQEIIGSDVTFGDRFGISVAVNGNTAIVGANGKNNSDGAAYVFVRSGTTWTQQQKLTASDPVSGDGFGISVSVDLGTAVSGALGKNTFKGAAYMFTFSAAPVITNVTSTTANGTYASGAAINVTLTFSDTVTVTGTPQIALNSGGVASYVSGSGTPTLSFTYTVGAGQNSSHLDYSSSTALTLNSGTINASDGTTPATLTLPAPGAVGSLSANSNIVITNQTPYMIGGTITVSGNALSGVTVTLTGTQSGSIVTNGSGSYMFTGMTAGGNATVTPSLSGYTFTPPSQSFTLSGNQTANFTANASPTQFPRAVFRNPQGAIQMTTYPSSTLSYAGGVFASDPSAAQDSTGNTFVTARDTFNSIWANVYNPQTSSWSTWRFGGGIIQGVPSIAVDTSGTAWIASRDMYNSYWLVSFTSGGGFASWLPLLGIFSTDPLVTACGDGSIYLIGKDAYNSLWSAHYIPGTGFQGWKFGGGIISGKPAATCGTDNAVYVVAEDNYNSNWMARVVGNTWTSWNFGGAITSVTPRIAALGNGSEAVVILDSTNVVWRTTFTEGAGNGWQPWVQVGGILQDVAPAGANGQLYFAGKAPNGDLWWWLQNGSQWTWIANNGAAAGALSVVPR